MNTVAIVQTRMASTRLPGKVLMDIGGRSVLAEVLRRCQAIDNVNSVICATATSADCDAIVEEAGGAGVAVFRGSENDVLSRYYEAARAASADVVMRITSDCPLTDPAVCSALLRLRQHTGADYAANNLSKSWPHGLDCEAFTMEALERAHQNAVLPSDREHVTPWLRRSGEIVRENLAGPGGRATNYRWTLDYPSDLEFLRSLFGLLPPPPFIPTTAEVMALLAERPALIAINSGHIGHSRPVTTAS